MTHKHLPMIDNFEFMQWCDIQGGNGCFRPANKRMAFKLVHQDGLTVKQAAKRMSITKHHLREQANDYIKLADDYLNIIKLEKLNEY